MYSKEELIAKAIPELLDIAHSMGAVTTGNSDQESLAYAILDKQAEDEGNKIHLEPNAVEHASSRRKATKYIP